MSKSYIKGVKSRLNSDMLSNTTWSGRGYLHSHMLLNNWLTLEDYLSMYSSLLIDTSSRSNVGISTNLKLACGRVNHCHAGQASILSNDGSAWLLLSYILAICTYQVYMHCIPRFQFCGILRWQMSIKSLSIFEQLTCLAHLRKQLRLCDKAFPITYPLGCFCESDTTWVVQIEVIPIYHTPAQTLRYVYFAIIAYYFDTVELLHGVTGSLILNVCTQVGIHVPLFFLLFYLCN